MLVKIDDIKIKNRVRRDLGDLDSLKDSLKTYGLLNPITITQDYVLVAGERRLQAAISLGWENINANIIDNADEIRQLEIEMEENNQRKEFSNEELLEGYEKLNKLKNPSLWMKIKQMFVSFFAWIKRLFK